MKLTQLKLSLTSAVQNSHVTELLMHFPFWLLISFGW